MVAADGDGGGGEERTPVTTPSKGESPGRAAQAFRATDLAVEDAEDDGAPGEKAAAGGEDDGADAEAAQRLMFENVSLRHSEEFCPKFIPKILSAEEAAWTDRKYTYTEIPEEMLGALFWCGAHKKVPSGSLTVRVENDLVGTVFAWSAEPPNGGNLATSLGPADSDDGAPAQGGEESAGQGWREIGIMKFADRDELRIWATDVPGPDTVEDADGELEVKIPLQAPWIGGVAFKLAPEDTVVESDGGSSERGPGLFMTFVHGLIDFVEGPIEHTTALAEKAAELLVWAPAARLELEILRREAEETLLTLAKERAGPARSMSSRISSKLARCTAGRRPRWWLLCRRRRAEWESMAFLPEEVLEAFERSRPQEPGERKPVEPSQLQRAAAGEFSPKRTACVVASRICFVALLLLQLYAVLALIVFLPARGGTAAVASTGPALLIDATAEGETGPLAAGAAVSLRNLWEYPQLSHDELRRIEDVVFVHNQATHILRVALVTKAASGSVGLVGADGSTIRVEPNGRAFWRPPAAAAAAAAAAADGGAGEPPAAAAEVPLESMEALRKLPPTPQAARLTSSTLALHAVA